MIRMLNDTERIVIETIRMRLTTQQALQYCKDNGFDISRATYFRYKRRVEETKLERLYHIAKIGFVHQHLERIDHIELALKEMWTNYVLEKDISKKVSILEKIVMLQPYLSSYYEATSLVIDVKLDKTGLVHCQPKFAQTKNSLIHLGNNKIANHHVNRSKNIQDLIREEEEKKEIDKKVYEKYIHEKNNFVV